MVCRRQGLDDIPAFVLLVLGSPLSHCDVFPHLPTTPLPACSTCLAEKEMKPGLPTENIAEAGLWQSPVQMCFQDQCPLGHPGQITVPLLIIS